VRFDSSERNPPVKRKEHKNPLRGNPSQPGLPAKSLFSILFSNNRNFRGTRRYLAVSVGKRFTNSLANQHIWNIPEGMNGSGWEAWTRTRIIRSRI
jgi:hypothetical protein